MKKIFNLFIFILLVFSLSAFANVAEVYEQANNYFWNKDYISAIKSYREVINKYPGSVYADKAMFGLGSSFFNIENYDKAVEAYSRLERELPDSNLADDAVFRIAESFEKLGQIDKSKLYYQKLVSAYPNSLLKDQAQEKINESATRLKFPSEKQSNKNLEVVKAKLTEKKSLPKSNKNSETSLTSLSADADASVVKEISYEVKPEDTLATIAEKFYGDFNKYSLIAQYNNISNPADIRAGQKIIIPLKNQSSTEPTEKSKKTVNLPALSGGENYSDDMIYNFKIKKERERYENLLKLEREKRKKVLKEVRKLENEITKLNFNIDSYKEKLKSLDHLKDEINKLQQNNSSLTDLLKREKQRNILMESKYKTENLKLQKTIDDLNKTVLMLNKKNDTSEFKNLIAQKEQEIGRLNLDLKQQLFKIKNLEADKKLLKLEIAKAEEGSDELLSVKAKLAEIKKQLEDKDAIIKKLQAEKQETYNKFVDREKEIIDMKTAYLTLKKKMNTEGYEDKIAQLTLELNKKEAEVRALNDELKNLRTNSVSKFGDFDRKQKEWSVKLDSIEKQLQKTIDSNKELLEKNQNLLQENLAIKENILDKENQIAKLKQQSKVVNLKKSEETDQIKGIMQEMNNLKNQLLELRSENLELKKKNIGFLSEIENLRTNEKVITENVRQKQTDFEKESLKKELDLLKEEIKLMKSNTNKPVSHKEDIRDYIQKAKILQSQGDLEKASQYYEKVLALEPLNADALNSLAIIYSDQNKNLDTAIEYLNKSIAVNPRDKGYYYDSLGWIYYKKGQPEKAKELIENAKTMVPDSDKKAKATICFHLGQIYFELKDSDNAFFQFIEVLKLVPNTYLAAQAQQKLELL